MNKKWFSFLIMAALLMAVVVSSGQVAQAHAELEGAVPAPGSTITQSPKQLRLIFSEGIESIGSSISLLDASNNPVALDEAQLDPADADNRTLIVGVPATLPAGTYTVQWRNLSVDGHSEKGAYSFTLSLIAPTPTAAIPKDRDVTVKFALKAGQTDVACTKTITGLGASKSTVQISDARLYLSNIKLLSSDGKAVPLQLAADNKWQGKDVALLDFENASGLCKVAGTTDTRTIVVGKVPAGQYTGITFDLGVPVALNHADVATAKAPLNVAALWTSRQDGYKFVRIDLNVNVSRTNTSAPSPLFPIQLGSLGCSAVATATVAASKPCANLNVAQVRLTHFDPAKDTIVADLAALLTDVNLTPSKPMPAGCLPSTANADCTRLFANLGLVLATGQCLSDCNGAKFFRVEVAKS